MEIALGRRIGGAARESLSAVGSTTAFAVYAAATATGALVGLTLISAMALGAAALAALVGHALGQLLSGLG